jgi:hypothetical protein
MLRAISRKRKIMSWITESNRLKHLIFAIPIGFIFTILCVLGVASGMEFKDRQWGGKWDWMDWTATMIGGFVGQAFQVLLIYLIYTNPF